MHRLLSPSASAVVMCVALSSLVWAACPPSCYVFQSVINPDDPVFTQLLGINNSGTIAGYFGDGRIVPNNGFTLDLPNTFTPENFPGAVQTQVIGINGNGDTAGFWIDGVGTDQGFTNIGGSFMNVDFPGPHSC